MLISPFMNQVPKYHWSAIVSCCMYISSTYPTYPGYGNLKQEN